MAGGGAFAVGACFLLCALACIGSVNIAQVVLGAQNLETENCWITKDSVGLGNCTDHAGDGRLLVCGSKDFPFGLAKWNLIGGGIGLGSLLLIFLFGGGLALCVSSERVMAAVGGTVCFVLFLIPIYLFNVAWFIIGIILMVRLPDTCKTEYRPLWDMSVAALVFGGLGLVNSIFSSKNRKQEKYERV